MIRRLSPLTFLVGLAIGLGVGLYYAWLVNPVILTEISPSRMNQDDKQRYAIAVSLTYAEDHDLVEAATRLSNLGLDDPFQYVADTACNLARSSFASSTTGLVTIRSMTTLATSQGKQTCASTLIAAPATRTPIGPSTTPGTPTPVVTDVPTKTASPTLGPTYTPATPIVRTAVPSSDFTLIGVRTFCDVKTPGTIDINVYDVDGKTGLPGIQIQVVGASTQDTFYTGLKPEQGDGFADFRMTSGESYTIVLAGADQKPDVQASDCSSKQGKSVTSYEADYRRTIKP